MKWTVETLAEAFVDTSQKYPIENRPNGIEVLREIDPALMKAPREFILSMLKRAEGVLQERFDRMLAEQTRQAKRVADFIVETDYGFLADDPEGDARELMTLVPGVTFEAAAEGAFMAIHRVRPDLVAEYEIEKARREDASRPRN